MMPYSILKPINVVIKGLLFGAVILLLPGCSDDNGNAQRNWQLVWQDEFDGLTGESPNPTNWRYDIGTDWGNAQLEFDTDRPENASLDGQGNLLITARRESFNGQQYTSARITTKGLFERAYGRFEARIKMPRGAGIWPAFWLLGANIDQVSWPECGEIDIVELRGQAPTVIAGTVHGPGYSAGNGVTTDYRLTNGRFDTDFHLFAIEWGADFIDFFVDDEKYQSLEPNDLPGDWVYDHPFYIILNVAVGGGYVGPPNAQTPFPQSMVIDYVRVYQEVE
jgi:beta-glucanase (GH16 family)